MRYVTILFSILILAACDVVSLETIPPPTDTPLPVTDTPPPADGSQPATATPDLSAEPPTQPPLLNIWPLAADMYYLNDAGRVWQQPATGDSAAAIPISREEVVIRAFALSPTGDGYAYRTDDAVVIEAIAREEREVLEQGIGAPESEQLLAYAPDGYKLAYTVQNGLQIYVAGVGPNFGPQTYNAPGTPIRDLQWSDDSQWLLADQGDIGARLYRSTPDLSLWVDLGPINGAAWLADGRLLFAPTSGGLAVLNPAELESRQFIVPQERAVSLPAQRTDGSIAFFVHEGSIDQSGFLHSANPADLSFSAVSSVGVTTLGWAWNADATRLVRPDGEQIAVLDPNSGAQNRFDAQENPLAFDWTPAQPTQVAGVTMPADLYYLAPSNGVVQVWRLPADGSAPQQVTSAAADVIDFDVASGLLVYTSGGVLYRQTNEGPDEEVVELREGVERSTPDISPDGSLIAYANEGIWTYDLEGDFERRLLRDLTEEVTGNTREIQVYSQPRWSSDGAWLLLELNYFEGSDLALTPVTEFGIVSIPKTLSLFGADGVWAESGGVIAFSPGGPFADPVLALATPGEGRNDDPTITLQIDFPVLHARQRDDGGLLLLRLQSPRGFGSSSVTLYTAELNGTNLIAASRTFIIDEGLLSSDGTFIAGLTGAEEGPQTIGQLTVIDAFNGEVVIIEGATEARSLKWGP